MILSISSGCNAPEPTNVLMKVVGDSVSVDVTAFTTEQTKVYNDFFGVIGSFTTVHVINSPIELDVAHITPKDVALEFITIDYNTLSATKKKKVDALFQLLETIE